MSTVFDNVEYVAAPESGGVDAGVKVLLGLGPVLGAISTASLSAPELEALVDAYRVGQRHLDALGVRIGVAAERLSSRPDGEPRGRSTSELLLGRTGSVRASTARRDAARAGVVATMGCVGAAAQAGLVGGDQLDSLARATRGLTDEQKALLDSEDLAAAAAELPADVFHRKVAGAVIALQDDHGLADTNAKREASEFRHWFDDRSGMGRFSGRLDPERYETLIGAVEAKAATLANAGGVTKDANLAATALLELVGNQGGGSAGRAHLTVVVDGPTLQSGFHPTTTAETGDGHRLPPESVARLACDAVLQRVTVDGRGVPIDVGRQYRTATDGQWRAARAVYSTCAWAGCDRPLSWCQLHHIHEWERGGPTDLCNLVPLCSRHHHLVHEGGWRVRLDPNSRTLEIFDPEGRKTATTKPDRIAHRLAARNGIQRE